MKVLLFVLFTFVLLVVTMSLSILRKIYVTSRKHKDDYLKQSEVVGHTKTPGEVFKEKDERR